MHEVGFFQQAFGG